MKSLLAATALFASVLTIGVVSAPEAQARGCIRGALVGGVAGHVAGHHGLMGAAAGCAVGHHMANRQSAQPTNTPAQQQRFDDGSTPATR